MHAPPMKPFSAAVARRCHSSWACAMRACQAHAASAAVRECAEERHHAQTSLKGSRARAQVQTSSTRLLALALGWPLGHDELAPQLRQPSVRLHPELRRMHLQLRHTCRESMSAALLAGGTEVHRSNGGTAACMSPTSLAHCFMMDGGVTTSVPAVRTASDSGRDRCSMRAMLSTVLPRPCTTMASS